MRAAESTPGSPTSNTSKKIEYDPRGRTGEGGAWGKPTSPFPEARGTPPPEKAVVARVNEELFRLSKASTVGAPAGGTIFPLKESLNVLDWVGNSLLMK